MKKRAYTVVDEPEDIFRFIEIATFRYETEDTRALMETVRRCAESAFGAAIHTGSPLLKMARVKDQMVGRLRYHTKELVSGWCLCRHLFLHGDGNGILVRERGKWISLITEMCGLSAVDCDVQKVKRKFLNAYWKGGARKIAGENYAANPGKVVATIYSKMANEGIDDIKRIGDVAEEFSTVVDELITIISEGNYLAAIAHADRWFPTKVSSTGNPRGRRRRK